MHYYQKYYVVYICSLASNIVNFIISKIIIALRSLSTKPRNVNVISIADLVFTTNDITFLVEVTI